MSFDIEEKGVKRLPAYLPYFELLVPNVQMTRTRVVVPLRNDLETVSWDRYVNARPGLHEGDTANIVVRGFLFWESENLQPFLEPIPIALNAELISIADLRWKRIHLLYVAFDDRAGPWGLDRDRDLISGIF